MRWKEQEREAVDENKREIVYENEIDRMRLS